MRLTNCLKGKIINKKRIMKNIKYGTDYKVLDSDMQNSKEALEMFDKAIFWADSLARGGNLVDCSDIDDGSDEGDVYFESFCRMKNKELEKEISNNHQYAEEMKVALFLRRRYPYRTKKLYEGHMNMHGAILAEKLKEHKANILQVLEKPVQQETLDSEENELDDDLPF